MYGARGLVGRAACAALAARGLRVRPLTRTDARTDDDAGLVRAFTGCAVVICAAGPLRETAEPVLRAALAAHAHYVDVGGEQAVLAALHERHESTARRAGLVALPGCGVNGALGDLAVAWAATQFTDTIDFGAVIRAEPASERVAEGAPLDEVCTTYVYDGLALSAAAQRSVFGAIGERARVWQRDRWDPAPTTGRHASRRVNAGGAFGERDAAVFAGCDVITIPRHVEATFVASYLSTTKNALAARALGLVSRVLPLVPAAASEKLAAYAASPEDCAKTKFAVVAQIKRGFAASQIVVSGVDPYRTTGELAAFAAHALATRPAGGPLGMRALAEVVRAEPALRSLGLTLEPSFAS